MSKAKKSNGNATRPLRADDLMRMISIDQEYTNKTRKRFFEKRLEAARIHPDDFIHVGLDRSGTLVAFAFARILAGEFGREQTVAVLDIIGVARDEQEHGYGHALMHGLCDRMREKGVRTLHSQADWMNHRLLHFFNSTGFELAPRIVLQRSTVEPLAEQAYEI
ncbi:MAG: GNAT family N-acetyltransferase [Rhizobiales bacterium]|nr:GNAT family N-acetyltransferase [Hyphomicrobiales bacterium]